MFNAIRSEIGIIPRSKLGKMEPIDLYNHLASSPLGEIRELAHSYAKAAGLGSSIGSTTTCTGVVHQVENGEVDSDIVALLVGLSDIFDDDGKWKRGVNARMALLLFGDSKRTGGNYNRVIQHAKLQLISLCSHLAGRTQFPFLPEFNEIEGETHE